MFPELFLPRLPKSLACKSVKFVSQSVIITAATYVGVVNSVDFREGDEDSNFSIFRVQRFTEWPRPLHWIAFPVQILTKPLIHWMPAPFSPKNPFFFSLRSVLSHPLPKNRLLLVRHITTYPRPSKTLLTEKIWGTTVRLNGITDRKIIFELIVNFVADTDTEKYDMGMGFS